MMCEDRRLSPHSADDIDAYGIGNSSTNGHMRSGFPSSGKRRDSGVPSPKSSGGEDNFPLL